METIDFNQVVTDNIGVIEGLVKPFKIQDKADSWDIIEPGLYYVASPTKGTAPKTGNVWGSLLVIFGGYYKTQVYISSNGEVHMRGIDPNPSAWVKLV